MPPFTGEYSIAICKARVFLNALPHRPRRRTLTRRSCPRRIDRGSRHLPARCAARAKCRCFQCDDAESSDRPVNFLGSGRCACNRRKERRDIAPMQRIAPVEGSSTICNSIWAGRCDRLSIHLRAGGVVFTDAESVVRDKQVGPRECNTYRIHQARQIKRRVHRASGGSVLPTVEESVTY